MKYQIKNFAKAVAKLNHFYSEVMLLISTLDSFEWHRKDLFSYVWKSSSDEYSEAYVGFSIQDEVTETLRDFCLKPSTCYYLVVDFGCVRSDLECKAKEVAPTILFNTSKPILLTKKNIPVLIKEIKAFADFMEKVNIGG